MLDLSVSPVWREVGFYDVCNTRGYHFSGAVDRRLDTELLNGYSATINKVASLDHHSPLGAVLDPAEISSLLHFADVHLMRNPLSSYRMAFHVVREYLVENPDAALPDDMYTDFPRLPGEIEALRAACREFGDPDVVQREDLVLEWVREKMEEDGPAHTFMRMPEEFDDMLLAQLEGPLIRAFRCQSVLYSEPDLFTTDNPFVLSGSADGEAILLAALTPHHLLVCSEEPLENDVEPLALLMPVPYLSFSTKILASAPMDLRLLWGARLPLAVDPERTLPKAELGQRVQMEWRNIPVMRKS